MYGCCCAASKPPLGSSRATPRVQLTARSAAGLMGSARPSSAPLGSARSSPHGPLTPAMPRLERTVSAAAALAQSAESPSKGLGVHGAPHAQRHLLAGQVTPREQLSWRGNPGKVPTSPFAADIVADSRSHSADVLLLQHTSCATVPERSDEADQESSPGEGTPDDAESRRPDLAASQQRSVPPLRLDNLPPESEDESSDSEANSDSEAAAEAPDGGAAGNTSSGVGIELTGDADEDVRRMLALEGYGSDSSSCSSDNGRCGMLLHSCAHCPLCPVVKRKPMVKLDPRSTQRTQAAVLVACDNTMNTYKQALPIKVSCCRRVGLVVFCVLHWEAGFCSCLAELVCEFGIKSSGVCVQLGWGWWT